MRNKYYGYTDSPIGTLEIICTEDALLSLKFVENKGELEESSNSHMVQQVKLQLEEYFKGNRKDFDLKLAFEGTEFQKGVWGELLNISYGKTINYKELAQTLGNEKAVRAVGNANGKNKIWIVVPCHRVIGNNGDLRGYAGGVHRKQWLLEHEKKHSQY